MYTNPLLLFVEVKSKYLQKLDYFFMCCRIRGPASRPWRANGGHPGDDLEISWGIGSTKSRSDEVGRRRNENVCYIGRLLKLSGVPRRAPGGPMGVTHETILRYLGALEVLNLVPMRLEGIGTRMCAISVDY